MLKTLPIQYMQQVADLLTAGSWEEAKQLAVKFVTKQRCTACTEWLPSHAFGKAYNGFGPSHCKACSSKRRIAYRTKGCVDVLLARDLNGKSFLLPNGQYAKIDIPAGTTHIVIYENPNAALHWSVEPHATKQSAQRQRYRLGVIDPSRRVSVRKLTEEK